MGKMISRIYKGSYNQYKIVLRKNIELTEETLKDNISAGAVTQIKLNYTKTCGGFSKTGFLVLTNGCNETETIPYTNYIIDSPNDEVIFTVNGTLIFDYNKCDTIVNIDCGRIDCSNIDVRLVIKDALDGNTVIDKIATKTDASAGEFILELTSAETDIPPLTYYYTIAQISNGEIIPFENSTFILVEDCI